MDKLNKGSSFLKVQNFLNGATTPISRVGSCNRTIQEEFVDVTTITCDETKLFNQELALWLEEYNSVRPHQALDYKTPLEYIDVYFSNNVLPMSSSRTQS